MLQNAGLTFAGVVFALGIFVLLIKKVRPGWIPKPQARPSHVIVANDDALSVWKDGQQLWSLAWGDVDEIRAYKDDAWSYDIINFVLFPANAGHGFRVDEVMGNYKSFLVALDLLPGVQEKDWWARVALPPFERCETVIWKRDTLVSRLASA